MWAKRRPQPRLALAGTCRHSQGNTGETHMKPCRVCRTVYPATPHQIKKSDFLCVPCRRETARIWRKKRKDDGRPVISSKLPREWHRQYEKDYYSDPENRKRIAAHMRRYAKDPRLRQKHKARWITNRAIKSGVLLKAPCVSCGESKSEAHHEDYSKPLEVLWLCRTCHMSVHRNAKAKGGA